MKSLILQVTLLAFISASFSLPARADVITTTDYLAVTARAGHLAQIDRVLTSQEVRAQLVRLGVAPEQALERIAELPDEELAALAGQMEDMPAGGSALALVGAVFIVLMILELTGVINIFNNF